MIPLFYEAVIQPEKVTEKKYLVDVINNNVVPVIFFLIEEAEFFKVDDKIAQNFIKKGICNK